MIKGFIRFAGAVLLGLAVLYTLSCIFSPKYITENMEGRISSEFYREKTDLDVVFFGTSTTYCSIAPPYLWDRFGFTSYTRAGDSETMWQTYYLLRDTVRYNKPGVVVLDMSSMKFGEEFVEEPANRKIIDGMRLSKDKLDCARASMYKDESLASYVFPVFRFHSRWDELKTEDFRYAFEKPVVTHDGYLMSYEAVNDDEANGSGDEYMKLPDKSVEYLIKIMEYCRDNDIKLFLVKSPTYINWYESYDEEIRSLCSPYGVEYTNFDDQKDEMGLVRAEDYSDGHSHLNIYGAEKYCDHLGKYIKDRADIPDHRDDPSYSAVWSVKYDRYTEDKRV